MSSTNSRDSGTRSKRIVRVGSLASARNPRVLAAAKLRRRAGRAAHPDVLIEGCRELDRALNNGCVPATVFFLPTLCEQSPQRDLLQRCLELGAEAFECTPSAFARLAIRENQEGLVAVAPRPAVTLAALSPPDPALVLVAESVEKPGNLGALLRSADAAGVDAVIVCDRRTDVHNPNVVRASLGTVFTVPVVETDSHEARRWLRARGLAIVATSPAADVPFTSADMRGPVAVVVGSEQHGLSRDWLDNADLAVRIPMAGQGDSLNLATTAALLVFEAVRQRAGRA